MKDLITSKTVYVCPFCGKESANYNDILNCLENHNVIFVVKEANYSHDCWGNNTTDYVENGKVYKKYKDAFEYCKGNDMQIVIKELS